MKLALSTLFLFHVLYTFAQDALLKSALKISCDCKDAIPLTIAGACKYGPTQAPVSYGKIQEINTTDKNSETSFIGEHNTAWYLLNIKFDGQLEFEIRPIDTTNDYDFLLFRYTDSTFCHSLLNKTLQPVRGNMSNNSHSIYRGITGLSEDAEQQFHKQGPGNPFSESIEVKKGEKYMLVVDNVTTKGKGHYLYFYNKRKVELKGVVLNADSFPVIADVILTDLKGKMITQTTTNVIGEYAIKTSVEENKNYSLTFSNGSSFTQTQIINTASIKKGSSFSNIKTILPQLKKGGKYKLGNINFYGGESRLLPESLPSVEALFQLLAKNKKMLIRIEGHVNSVFLDDYERESNSHSQYQQLSDDRAEAIYTYLVKKGIAATRMKTVGLADTEMLFPHAKNAEEQAANRRVEIKVLSIHGE